MKFIKGSSVKIIKHSFCNLSSCPHVGKTGIIEDVDNYEKFLWVRVSNGHLGKFAEEDLE